MPNNTITYYEYDSHGRLLRARLKENTTSGSVLLNTENKFDDLGRAVKSVYDLPKLGEKMTYTVSYKGNAAVTSGRIASIGLPNGKSISYGYDKFDRITSKSMGLTASSSIAEYYSYWTNGNMTANLVTGHNLTIPGISVTYSYTYDNYGNILTVKEGSTLKLSYVYDDLNQLTRENNAYANKTYVYTYDKNGNILTKKTYAYTTGTLGTVQSTINYTYGNSSLKDLLTNYNGTAISYDGSGNPTNWRGNLNTLTWTGRELTGITMPSSQTMSYKYNADGIRTQKTFTDNAVKYYYKHDYILDGAKVVAETITYFTYFGTNTTETLYYYYDESGAPTGIKYNGNVYYFQKNLQGDIIRILNTQGSIVATYTYDAWGNIIASTDTSGVSIGTKNPFRYRGYYYDTETRLYYLQSRYYDPQVGRFINADEVVNLGANNSLSGYNAFAYCSNNPVMNKDPSGNAWYNTAWDWLNTILGICNPVSTITGLGAVTVAIFQGRWNDVVADFYNGCLNPFNQSEEIAAQTKVIGFYYGSTVIRHGFDGSCSILGTIWLKEGEDDPNVFKHEYGHSVQERLIGPLYYINVALPSAIYCNFGDYVGNPSKYYSMPWERPAEMFGNPSRDFEYKDGSLAWGIAENILGPIVIPFYFLFGF